jgi:hypothetical protein
MKNILTTIFICLGIQTFAQLAWVEPVPTIATEKITIYVDLSKADMSNANIAALVAYEGPLYLWTWKPAELPGTNPRANGTWANSNEALQMTKAPDKGPQVWKFEMIPTEFYGVTPAEVYSNGLAFLVKAKDGSGSPEKKTDDITLAIEPPVTDKGSLYNFPSILLKDEITTLVYDNAVEKKPSMQNLPANTQLYIYLKATARDTVSGVIGTYEPYRLLQTLGKPNLLLRNVGSSKWTYGLIVQQFFNFPPTAVPIDLEMRVVKENWASDNDTGGNFPKLKIVEFGCE